MAKKNKQAAATTATATAAPVIDSSTRELVEIANTALSAYCFKADKRTAMSAAAQLTKQLTTREMALSECVSFCQQFYATIPNSNCVWLCEDKTASSTMQKHVKWLEKRGIFIEKINGKYSINHERYFQQQ
jgi:hypothetical protein